MTAADKPKPRGAGMSPQQRAERVRQLLIARKAPPLEEGDEIKKLSSNSTLAVILTVDDLFRAAAFKEAPTWEQYTVICGMVACLSDAITQFTGLPREGVPYMVADAIHFMFSGPERAKWPKMEVTYNFALAQYKHMMTEKHLNPMVDVLGGAFYDFLGSDEEQYVDLMKTEFKKLVDNPDVPQQVADRGKN